MMAASDFEAGISLRYAAIRSLHGDAGPRIEPARARELQALASQHT